MGPDLRDTVSVPSATPGWSLDTWQYLPTGQKPFPAVVMAHGFCCLKRHNLHPFAVAFVKAGCAVLLFDYRHFGESDGSPRNVLVPKRQVQDYHSVIAYARTHSDLFDAERIGVFGTSQSGGNVFQVASEDAQLAFGIAQCPYTELDLSPVPDLRTLKHIVRMLASFTKQALGFAPVYIPAIGLRGSGALLASAEACEGVRYLAFDIEDTEVNRVDATVAWYESRYKPGRSAPRIECPFLCLAGTEDDLVPAELARKYIAQAPLGELYNYEGRHFDPYPGGKAHEDVLQVEVAFMVRHTRTSASFGAPS